MQRQKLHAQGIFVLTRAHAQALSYNVSKVRARFTFLHGLGLTRQEAASVVARCPTVLGLSVEANLWPKVEYLSSGLNRTADTLVTFPKYLTLSLQHRCGQALTQDLVC